MKKKLAGLLAALMVLCMGTTVFAAGSSDKESDMQKEAAALATTIESGDSSVQLNSTAVTPAELTAAYEKVNQVVESSTGFQMLAAVQISTVSALPQGGVSVKINVPGIQAGTKNIRVYHQKTDGSWEIKTPYVGNGYVTAPFDSFSPFFVVKYDSTPSSSDGSVDASTIVNNYYNTTNSTTNNTTNNTTTSSTTNSPVTTNNSSSNTNNAYTTTNSNNNATNSYNASTNSNNATTSNSTTTSNGEVVKKESTTSTTKKTTVKKPTTTKKKTVKKPTTSKSTPTNEKSSSGVSNNTQTVTVNVNGGGSNSGSSSLKAGATTSTTSPKTGASMPVLPIIAVFALMGIAVCGKKARNL